MASFCIPKQISQKLKEAATRGEIKIAEIYKMTAAQREEFFAGYTDKRVAKGISDGFSRAIGSKQETALESWVKRTFGIKAAQKNVLDKIKELSESGALTPENSDAFMQDLVAEKLGVTVSAEEAQKINELSEGLQEEFEKEPDKYGVPSKEYFKKRAAMDDYLQSLVPTPQLKVLTSTIGRGSLLFNIKSPIVNVIGNTVQAIGQSLERRIASGQYTGAVDESITKGYFNLANEIFKETGFDITRMFSYSEGVKTLGEQIIHSQGKGVIRKVGRFYEDLVFKKMLGAPDVAFSAANFADSANLAATKFAESEGLKGDEVKTRATEIFLDAASVTPNTLAGEAVRNQAMADALMATFQNESNYSSVALAIRGLFNTVSGDLRIGDQIMPFVKTPANVVGFSLDAGGLGAIKGLAKLPNAVSEFKTGNPAPMREVARDFTRTGLGMLIAFLISALIPPEDFVGRYPTTQKERELLTAKNVRENSIKIGGKWVSMDYFGFLGAPLVGFLYAKKYGDGFLEDLFAYSGGVGLQSLNIPGFELAKDTISAIADLKPGEGQTPQEVASEALNDAVDFIRARTVPGIVFDLAKAFDTSEREVDYANPVQRVQSTIPFLRNQLPEKVDVFGTVLKAEPWYSTILFGSRVKSPRDTELIKEMDRLDSTNNLPSLTRPEKTSERAKALKTQIGDEKFREAMGYFRENYKKDVTQLIKTGGYKRMDDEDKAAAIDAIKSDSLEKTLKRYHYKKPKK